MSSQKQHTTPPSRQGSRVAAMHREMPSPLELVASAHLPSPARSTTAEFVLLPCFAGAPLFIPLSPFEAWFLPLHGNRTSQFPLMQKQVERFLQGVYIQPG